MITRCKNGQAIFNELNQCVYIFGGWDEKETMKTVFKYGTLPSEEAKKRVSLELGEMDFDGFLLNNIEGHAAIFIPETLSVFIFGGFDGIRVTDTIMKYNLKTHQCEIINEFKLSEPRENLTGQLIDLQDGRSLFVLVCGWNGHESSKTVDIFAYDREKDAIIGIQLG